MLPVPPQHRSIPKCLGFSDVSANRSALTEPPIFRLRLASGGGRGRGFTAGSGRL